MASFCAIAPQTMAKRIKNESESLFIAYGF